MKKNSFILSAALLFASLGNAIAQEKPDTLWFKFDDRFTANEILSLANVDSLEFTTDKLTRYIYYPSLEKVVKRTHNYRTNGTYGLGEMERYLVKPNNYSSIDFTKETSQFCFQRSVESEHFVLFWEKGLTRQSNGNITGGASSSICNTTKLLNNAEKIWDVYVDKLGFITPGKSTTDKVKVEMFIVNQSEWRDRKSVV